MTPIVWSDPATCYNSGLNLFAWMGKNPLPVNLRDLLRRQHFLLCRPDQVAYPQVLQPVSGVCLPPRNQSPQAEAAAVPVIAEGFMFLEITDVDGKPPRKTDEEVPALDAVNAQALQNKSVRRDCFIIIARKPDNELHNRLFDAGVPVMHGKFRRRFLFQGIVLQSVALSQQRFSL